MYFVLYVVIIYLNIWLDKSAKGAIDRLLAADDTRAIIVFGLVGASIKGLGFGYTLWLIYHIATTYVIGKFL